MTSPIYPAPTLQNVDFRILRLYLYAKIGTFRHKKDIILDFHVTLLIPVLEVRMVFLNQTNLYLNQKIQ